MSPAEVVADWAMYAVGCAIVGVIFFWWLDG